MCKVIVIGARRRRQGIGEFIARAFALAGVEVCGVVGTQEDSVRLARESLYEKYGIRCAGYLSLKEALDREKPDMVAVCSPIASHLEYLEAAAAAGVHCLCEKPLWWGEATDRTEVTAGIVDAFAERGRHLGLMTQWPHTLEAFFKIYPALKGKAVRRFEMLLSPITIGTTMVLDSASHPLSLLEALTGPGEVESPEAVFVDGDPGKLRMEFTYTHAGGAVEATCRLITTAEPPRPAGYAVNGFGVERRIEIPSYEMTFESAGCIVKVEDPVEVRVRDFLEMVRAGAAPDRESLIRSMRALEALMAAAATLD